MAYGIRTVQLLVEARVPFTLSIWELDDAARGRDMKLTVGVDFSAGFNSADSEKVNLYLTESFIFRVLDGTAIIPIQWKK